MLPYTLRIMSCVHIAYSNVQAKQTRTVSGEELAAQARAQHPATRKPAPRR